MSRWLSLRSLLIIVLLLFTTYRLPAPVSELPESSKLKRTFFTLKGHAVDTFANEKTLPPELDPAFGGGLHVLATRPLIELTELMRKFGRVSSYPRAYLSAGFEGENVTPEMQRREAAIKRIEKSQLKKIATTPTLSVATGSGARFSARDFPSSFFADHVWSVEGSRLDEHLTKTVKRSSSTQIEIPMDAFDSYITLTGYATRTNLEAMRRASPDIFKHGSNMEFYADVCRAGLPEHLIPITVRYDACGSSTEVDIETPLLQLRVLVLENITNKPVEVGKFHFRMINPGRGVVAVRTRAEDERLLASTTADSQSWYQPHVLKPGEKVMVPLELLLELSRSNRPEASVTTNRETRRACANRFSAEGELQTVAIMYEGKDPQSPKPTPLVVMSKQKFIDALLRKPTSVQESDEFIYGSSITLDAVDVDGPKYAIEPFDPMNIAYFSGTGEGSCPFLYCRRSSDDSWVRAGTILTGRSSKEREGTTMLEVRNFDGVVRVSEEEEETSYVDQLFVRGVSPSGETVTVTAANDLLTHKDHRYLVLKRGEKAEAKFRIPEGMRRDRVEIIASGYFVPTSAKESR